MPSQYSAGTKLVCIDNKDDRSYRNEKLTLGKIYVVDLISSCGTDLYLSGERYLWSEWHFRLATQEEIDGAEILMNNSFEEFRATCIIADNCEDRLVKGIIYTVIGECLIGKDLGYLTKEVLYPGSSRPVEFLASRFVKLDTAVGEKVIEDLSIAVVNSREMAESLAAALKQKFEGFSFPYEVDNGAICSGTFVISVNASVFRGQLDSFKLFVEGFIAARP